MRRSSSNVSCFKQTTEVPSAYKNIVADAAHGCNPVVFITSSVDNEIVEFDLMLDVPIDFFRGCIVGGRGC